MDEVTQMEVVVSVEKISERYLIPAPEHLLQDLPFLVQGSHLDNGSEYVNKRVAKLLDKLRIGFTHHALERATITPWRKARIPMCCASYSATDISRNAGHR